MYIKKEQSQKVYEAVDGKLLDVLKIYGEVTRTGASYLAVCPLCNKKGLNYTPAKGMFKCFHCGDCKGKHPVDYLMSGKSMSYPEAIKYLAEHFNILIDISYDRPSPTVRNNSSSKKSFCQRMLSDSGLTAKDITASVFLADDNETLFKSPTFKKGTLNSKGKIDESGDDVIIYYYDLEGFPVRYTPVSKYQKKDQTEEDYYRVRWQFPDEHKDSSGRPAKYKSPYGAPSQIYIPQVIRTAYKNSLPIDRLYIQEGEKKAEKASLHGLPSLGIAGIQNFGQKGILPESVAKIVERCQVREIVFLLDSDCFDITNNIKINDPIDRRPRNFFYAVRNYKEYLNVLKNRGFYVEVFFGYVLANPKKDKGVDDLLSNTLKGKEDSLKADIDAAMNLKVMKGEYIELHKISTMTDTKLLEIWGLHSAEKFCERYAEQLSVLPEFQFGKNRYRYDEDGKLVSAQPLEPQEKFWREIEKHDKAGTKVSTDYRFFYEGSLVFLQNRGFGKYKLGGEKKIFTRIENRIINTVDQEEIRDFVMDFTRNHLNIDVLEMLHSGGPQYLGDFKLSSLQTVNLDFEKKQRQMQYLYFSENFWKITSSGIEVKEYSQLPHHIWREQKKDFNPSILPPLFHAVRHEDGTLSYKITQEGKKCHFLQFLLNTSNFTWKKEKALAELSPDATEKIEITPDDIYENTLHFIAKLCAIGYMTVSFKDPSVTKIVVGVDGELAPVGSSNGRTGKSLVGELMKRVTTTNAISGKTADPIKDPFIWDGITEKTRLVFIDDIRINFNMEGIFPNATNDWNVNYKGLGRTTYPYEDSPKIYITTNHMLSGSGSSYADRTWYIAFSDWYSDTRKPKDDFGELFFVEWDHAQWNLCWNFVAQCVKLYFELGVVESPKERVVLRQIRQDMGETFFQWTGEYFSNEERLNTAMIRKDMYESLIEFCGANNKDKTWYTPHRFKKSLVLYCQFMGYTLNPSKYDPLTKKPYKYTASGEPDIDDKRNGVEYFTIATPDYKPSLTESNDIFSDIDDEEDIDIF